MADLFLIPYVRAAWENLRLRLGPDGRLAIFGAGAHTRWLLSVTADMPGPRLIAVLDDDPRVAQLGGVPVRRPADVDPSMFDAMLVSSDQWEARLVERCRQLWGDRVPVVRLYEGLPPGPYDKDDDRTLVREHAARRAARSPAADRRVVVVAGHARSRDAKIGWALKHAGWRPVLLYSREPAFDARACYDEARAYTHPWQALRMACEYEAVAHHVMVNSDYRVADLFVRERAAPVVIDSYDIIAGMYTDEFLAARAVLSEQIETERNCLEHADGVVTRSLEVEFLRDGLGYDIRRILAYPDGCWNCPEGEAPAEPCGTGVPARHELHIAYAGNLSLEPETRDAFGQSGHRFWLAEALTGQGFHFHLYPSFDPARGDFEGGFAEYRALERGCPRFHLHRPVPADALVEELAACDLAVFVYNEYVFPGRVAEVSSAEKMRRCATNKVFDYVDARLPIVHNASPASALSRWYRQWGVGIDLGGVPVERWGEVIRAADLNSLREAADRARRALDVRKGVRRLTDFYELLAAGATAAGRDGEGQTDDHDDAAGRRPALVR